MEYNAPVWSDVRLTAITGVFKGVVLPRAENSDDQHIVLKLFNGYNIGIAVDKVQDIKVLGRKEAHYKVPEGTFPYDEKKPNVTLLGTGGTIASRLDYRTGAVIPAFAPGELYSAVPELADICNLDTRKIFGIFSENMGPHQWKTMAEEIGKEIRKGVDGVVIGHGTDTMHHTASIMSFMVQNPPVPIVIVGSQRSSDRPSSDAAINLMNATRLAAEGDIAEVVVSMFGSTSDDYNLIHRGTKVRKMHSSFRNTFRTISDIPIGKMDRDGNIQHFREDYNRRRKDTEVTIDTSFEDKVTLQYYYPNMQPDVIHALIDKGYKGIVIAGTGLGHVNKPLYEPLERAQEEGVAVYMTVQTLWGYTQMYVYDTGRDLLHRGVVPVDNMLPEVAYVKLAWALGKSQDLEEVKKIMQTPIAGEISNREPFNAYVILQGGVPEVDAYLKHHVP